jgi:hypothetical protein
MKIGACLLSPSLSFFWTDTRARTKPPVNPCATSLPTTLIAWNFVQSHVARE